MTQTKEYIQIFIVFIIFLAVIPCIAFLDPPENQPTQAAETDDSFTVGIYFTESGTCENYSIEEYMKGAVLAQMPADFEQEALKAQAVLARTYIQRRYETEKSSPTEALHGALISDDTELYQGFFTDEQAKDFYGDGFAYAEECVLEAVQAVEDVIVTYEGEPIIVAFHAVSSGHTASALDAWGEDIPYLQSVESLSDTKISGAENSVTMTSDELKEKLSAVWDDIEFTSSYKSESWLEITEQAENGYIKEISVCGRKISAAEFTETLGIASPCFTWEYDDGDFTFTSSGFGHLVGMSQYGANTMAENGSDYKEILMHYFSGVTVG